MKATRKRLLIELEDIIGNEFYNAKIQNWGPNGAFHGEGRAYRYPITFRTTEGADKKVRHVDRTLPSATIITGRYKVGGNDLNIMRGIDRILSHLETHYELDLTKHKK